MGSNLAVVNRLQNDIDALNTILDGYQDSITYFQNEIKRFNDKIKLLDIEYQETLVAIEIFKKILSQYIAE